MQAMRTIQKVDEKGMIQVQLPPTFGKRVELIILALAEDDEEYESGRELMKLQETSGFVREVLAHPAEDVWNDL